MSRCVLLLILTISFAGCIYSNTPAAFKDVGVTPVIGQQITTNIVLQDAFNQNVDIADIIQQKPTIITFVYLNCPMLCHLMLDGLAEAIQQSNYKLGKDYQIITISIDPNETNENLRNYQNKYYNQLTINNGWLFLKGTDQTIKKITDFFGYQYKYIPRTNDYAHPSVIFFYKDQFNNYIEGVTYDTRSFDYAIMSLKDKKTIKEHIVTFCYYFDPDNQTYSLMIFNILRLLCLITVLILIILISYFVYKERKNNKYGDY